MDMAQAETNIYQPRRQRELPRAESEIEHEQPPPFVANLPYLHWKHAHRVNISIPPPLDTTPSRRRRLYFLFGTSCTKDKFRISRGTVVWSPLASSASVQPFFFGQYARMPQARDIMSYLATLSVALVM